jgi:Fic-DOC domain mobile mystery protein B
MNTIDVSSSPENTPLTVDEVAQLIPNLATQSELNEFERLNILEATKWAFNSRIVANADPLTEPYIRELHRRMFDNTWRWAGLYRNTEKNLGVLVHEIRNRIPALLTDARYWVDNRTYSVDEIAIRVHHGVTVIHPFPNGNGRHARLLADIIAVKLNRPEFTWGTKDMVSAGPAREAYIKALRKADDGDLLDLLAFSRS